MRMNTVQDLFHDCRLVDEGDLVEDAPGGGRVHNYARPPQWGHAITTWTPVDKDKEGYLVSAAGFGVAIGVGDFLVRRVPKTDAVARYRVLNIRYRHCSDQWFATLALTPLMPEEAVAKAAARAGCPASDYQGEGLAPAPLGRVRKLDDKEVAP